MNSAAKVISIQETIGRGYADYWKFKGRYRVCKGSRASKKNPKQQQLISFQS